MLLASDLATKNVSSELQNNYFTRATDIHDVVQLCGNQDGRETRRSRNSFRKINSGLTLTSRVSIGGYGRGGVSGHRDINYEADRDTEAAWLPCTVTPVVVPCHVHLPHVVGGLSVLRLTAYTC